MPAKGQFLVGDLHSAFEQTFKETIDAASYRKLFEDKLYDAASKSPPPPLAPQTIRNKRKNKAPFIFETWQESGYLIQSRNALDVNTSEGAHGFSLFAKPPMRQHPMHADSSMNIAQMVNALEFGLPSNNQPARPVLYPTVDRITHINGSYCRKLREDGQVALDRAFDRIIKSIQ